jgi:UDP-N-acetylglucosamine 2-epimerase
MNIVTVVGARPQFIKSAPVSKAIAKTDSQEYLIHTGQHYDYGMSKIFFEEMGIREPNINLNVGSGTHAQQTSQMLVGIEQVLLSNNPDLVLVYGDTNSTLAGALAAAKLRIKLAHIEAGLRSFNRQMPEEHNRVLTDHCADLLFCPTQTAVDNLANEGIQKGAYLVGDTMYDAILQYSDSAVQHSTILDRLELNPKKYMLVTIHRAYNTDNPDVLRSILSAFEQFDEIVVFPAHPRTINALQTAKISISSNVKVIEPIGYLEMLILEQNARIILTDSGGIQKEAYFLKIPCFTLRPETEWVETTESGWNKLVGTETKNIVTSLKSYTSHRLAHPDFFGDGHASEKIVNILKSELNKNTSHQIA